MNSLGELEYFKTTLKVKRSRKPMRNLGDPNYLTLIDKFRTPNQLVCDFSERLTGYVNDLGTTQKSMMILLDLLTTADSVRDETGSTSQEVLDYVNNTFTQSQYTIDDFPTFKSNLPNGGMLDIETIDDSAQYGTNSYRVVAWKTYLDTDSQGDPIYKRSANNTNLLIVRNGTITGLSSADTPIKYDTSNHEVSYETISTSITNSLCASTIYQQATNLFAQGQLSVSNLDAAVRRNLTTSNEFVADQCNAIYEQISTITSSPLAFLAWGKQALSKLIGFKIGQSGFEYGVDEYNVETSWIIPTKAILNATGSILALVGSIIFPTLGVVFMAGGYVLTKLFELVDTNESTESKAIENASFYGYGNPITSDYISKTELDLWVDAFDKMTTSSNGSVYIDTPLFVMITYNYPVWSDSLGQNTYPMQLFLKPFIPLSNYWFENFLETFASTITFSNNRPANDYYLFNLDGTYPVFTQSARITQIKEFFEYMNEWPQDIHYINSKDNDAIIQTGCWYAYMCWEFMYDVSNQIQNMPVGSNNHWYDSADLLSDDASINSTRINHYNSSLGSRDLVLYSNWFLAYIYSVQLNLVQSGWWDYSEYSDPDDGDISEYFKVVYGKTKPFSDKLIYVQDSPTLDWALYNNQMIPELYHSLSFIRSTVTYNDYSLMIVTQSLAGDQFSPNIIPPQTKVNIWARLAITLGIVAVAIAGAIAAKMLIQNAGKKKFYTKCSECKKNYDTWKEDPSNTMAWKEYKRSLRKANKLGKLFGLGSFDGPNGWFNGPENNAAVAAQTASILGGVAETGEIFGYNIPDVMQQLSGSESTITGSISSNIDDVITLIRGPQNLR